MTELLCLCPPFFIFHGIAEYKKKKEKKNIVAESLAMMVFSFLKFCMFI